MNGSTTEADLFCELSGLDMESFFNQFFENICYKSMIGNELFGILDSEFSETRLIQHLVDYVGDDRLSVIRAGEKCNASVYFSSGRYDANALTDLYDEGCTLYFRCIDTLSIQLARLSKDIESLLWPLRLQWNLFCSPPESSALLAHFDTHDSFILQVSGSKAWDIWSDLSFDASSESAPAARRTEVISLSNSMVSDIEFSMKGKDMIYLPRGLVHRTTASKLGSVHANVWLLSPLLRWQ